MISRANGRAGGKGLPKPLLAFPVVGPALVPLDNHDPVPTAPDSSSAPDADAPENEPNLHPSGETPAEPISPLAGTADVREQHQQESSHQSASAATVLPEPCDATGIVLCFVFF